MSREIKFRAWSPFKNKMVFMEDGDLALNEYGVVADGPKHWGPQDYPLMQFTGLRDKNGKEIYEGDILSSANQNFEVLWDDQSVSNPGFVALTTRSFMGRRCTYSGSWALLVGIGNIYQNPELLEQEKQQ